MGKVFESIMPEHEAFMKGQPLFSSVRRLRQVMSICRQKGMIPSASCPQIEWPILI